MDPLGAEGRGGEEATLLDPVTSLLLCPPPPPPSLVHRSTGSARAIWSPHMSAVALCQSSTQGPAGCRRSLLRAAEALHAPRFPQLANGEGDSSPSFSHLGPL